MARDLASTRTRRLIALGGGVVFAASLLYGAVSYAGRFGRPAESSPHQWIPAAANILLFVAFGLHHSVFARASIKTRISAVVPPELERTVYVWCSSALFILLMWCWQPVPGTWWAIDGPAAWLLRGLQLSGVVLALMAGRLMDVRDLAGLRVPFGQARPPSSELTDRGPYRFVRHPLYLAWLLLVWAVPVMTSTRLLFAGLSTAYLLVAIPLEERDLRRTFGASYARYASQVRYRMLPGLY